MSLRLSNDPWKNFSSVRTLRHAAPPASYALAILTGSKSGWITPLDGDAFLTSAMRPGLPVAAALAAIAALKSAGGGAFLASACVVWEGVGSREGIGLGLRGEMAGLSRAAVSLIWPRQRARRLLLSIRSRAKRRAETRPLQLRSRLRPQPPTSAIVKPLFLLSALTCSIASGTLSRHASISLALYQTISSRMLRGWLSSGMLRTL